MRVLLDINMDTFFMQSASCNSTICNADHIGFNSSLSSTYAPTPLEQTIYYANVLFEGNLATDVLNVGGCDILSQGFLDATDAWPAAYVHLYYGYDGALGLAPGWANRRPHVPTLWENLVNEELLEKNIFSITLPSGERTMLGPPRENGELVLGGLPQGFREDESISLPLKFSTSVLRPWMTSLQSLTYGNNTLTFSNTTSSAYFTTVYPWISLPVHFARSILATIGYWEEMYPFIKFPCWLRGGLPDLIFGIGGHNVSLDPYQYSFVVRRSTDDPWLCAIALDRSDNHTVALGWSFMENFHVVFDTDAAVILRECSRLLNDVVTGEAN